MNDPIRPRAPQLQPLECDQAAVFNLPLGFYNPDAEGNADLNNPQDLTGKIFKLKVFETRSERSKVIAECTIDTTDLAIGKVYASLTPTQTAALNSGEFYYYLFETTESRYYLEGQFEVISHRAYNA